MMFKGKTGELRLANIVVALLLAVFLFFGMVFTSTLMAADERNNQLEVDGELQSELSELLNDSMSISSDIEGNLSENKKVPEGLNLFGLEGLTSALSAVFKIKDIFGYIPDMLNLMWSKTALSKLPVMFKGIITAMLILIVAFAIVGVLWKKDMHN